MSYYIDEVTKIFDEGIKEKILQDLTGAELLFFKERSECDSLGFECIYHKNNKYYTVSDYHYYHYLSDVIRAWDPHEITKESLVFEATIRDWGIYKDYSKEILEILERKREKFPSLPFVKFPSIARLTREVIVTEKIDGTNAQVCIDDSGMVMAAGRNGYINITNDNHGFAQWVKENEQELLKLGPGRHFGEWWGEKINRHYKLKEQRFSLFNRHRWNEDNIPSCCHVVPILWKGEFCTQEIDKTLELLKMTGSFAAPGFMEPEGIVVYHELADQLFKKTIKNDEKGKRQCKS